MKKILALLVAIVSFSCSNAQKKSFSKEALAETLVAFDGSEVTFQSILEKYKDQTLFSSIQFTMISHIRDVIQNTQIFL